MALIQIRDVPENIYRKLVAEATRERRSISRQSLAALARGLEVEIDPKVRRKLLLAKIKDNKLLKVSDPVKMIREDRRR